VKQVVVAYMLDDVDVNEVFLSIHTSQHPFKPVLSIVAVDCCIQKRLLATPSISLHLCLTLAFRVLYSACIA